MGSTKPVQVSDKNVLGLLLSNVLYLVLLFATALVAMVLLGSVIDLSYWQWFAVMIVMNFPFQINRAVEKFERENEEIYRDFKKNHPES